MYSINAGYYTQGNAPALYNIFCRTRIFTSVTKSIEELARAWHIAEFNTLIKKVIQIEIDVYTKKLLGGEGFKK